MRLPDAYIVDSARLLFSGMYGIGTGWMAYTSESYCA